MKTSFIELSEYDVANLRLALIAATNSTMGSSLSDKVKASRSKAYGELLSLFTDIQDELEGQINADYGK